MLKLLERNIETVDRRLVLLAPAGAPVLPLFRNVDTDLELHRTFVREMQQLRGSIYLRDGAVERRRLAPDGTHRTPEDEKSWHLLMVNKDQQVNACGWYMPHDKAVRFDSLRVRNCPLARTEGMRDTLRNAMESEIASARRQGLGYAEIGGWAATKESCFASEGLMLVLAGFSLSRICGGALGVTTATARHSSAAILRRLGGSSLEVDGSSIPPYYDPTYRCTMELLRFDSRSPNARYAGLIELLRERLATVRVICKPAAAEAAIDFAARRSRAVPEVPLGLEVPGDWGQPSAASLAALAVA